MINNDFANFLVSFCFLRQKARNSSSLHYFESAAFFSFVCLRANAQFETFGGGFSGPKSQLSLLALCRNN